MFRYIWILLFSLCLSSATMVRADEQVSDIVKGIQQKYSHLPGFHVSYTREIMTKSMAMMGESAKTDQATGQIYFMSPHFLKIDQETPKPEVMVTDGHILYWYLPHKKEAYRYPSQKVGEELRLLVDIFYGLRKAEERFKITLANTPNKEDHRIRLVPDPVWPQIDHIQLSVARRDFRIGEVEIHNHVGGLTRFILGDLSEKKDFKESFFTFHAPEGVKVIEEKD